MNRILRSFVSLFLIAVCGSYCFAARLTAEQCIATGQQALERWDYAGAAQWTTKALELDPLNVQAFSLRAFAYARLGQLDKAVFDASRAIQLDPNFAPAYFSRGVAFSHRDEIDKAIADLSEAVRLDPTNANDVSMRGDLYSRAGNAKGAMADYDRAIELDPASAVHYCCRGDLRVGLKDYSGAASDYLQSQKLNPEYAAPYISYSLLLASCPDGRIRDARKAVQYAEIGLNQNPNREDAWSAYAAALASAGRFDEAVKWETRYVNAKVLSQIMRSQAEARLDLYKSHQPFIAQ